MPTAFDDLTRIYQIFAADLADGEPTAGAMTAKTIIETKGLVMRFGGVEVLRGIDFAIEYGAFAV